MHRVAARQALVGAGANLGDRAATLRAATERLRGLPGITHVESSALYETEPIGGVDQPPFLNLVLGVETTLAPEQLLQQLLALEQQFGRVRTVRWGPRTLDLDLLAYEGETRTTTALTLPHPRMFERAFVLVPLQELLARSRFERPAWAELRQSIAAAQPVGGVTLRGATLPSNE
ncbi:2-amino-4-hydroxy-6-hydroxymethyldihydropteridine diphosphokinase [Opitutus terrae]|uniref:2-amino-4-hydroxy-6-hydroxymethyldihydropteridine pyrophosphokinase n=1 Tax=Opitutus terrae (strain DSM 11246 / JCM 15787 / PB90-1) TaxID=452637 RepID=B1ZQM1_OPITP|nr:2-amino-4-hydroxy-6-hydroxymethyldihydropteridine diphosphokinase [Opitutus terrae]ACB75630.1 2-amino-4-hydroxy-6-hydroxymethyldihydropteridine pyrophosphokinase [Opitutus terrae PB90-1]